MRKLIEELRLQFDEANLSYSARKKANAYVAPKAPHASIRDADHSKPHTTRFKGPTPIPSHVRVNRVDAPPPKAPEPKQDRFSGHDPMHVGPGRR